MKNQKSNTSGYGASSSRKYTLAILASIGLFTSGAITAATVTYSDRSLFEAAVGTSILVEDFEGFAGNVAVPSVFGGLATFGTPSPTTFAGGFGPGAVSGKALLANPPFVGAPIDISFATPVFGIGADLFDDFDGTPSINILTLTVTTSIGNTFSISETVNTFGQVGFLGIMSSEGITSAQFSVDSGTLELDSLTVAAVPIPAAAWLFGSGLLGLVGFARRKK